jgi:hypothetical protein
VSYLLWYNSSLYNRVSGSLRIHRGSQGAIGNRRTGKKAAGYFWINRDTLQRLWRDNKALQSLNPVNTIAAVHDIKSHNLFHHACPLVANCPVWFDNHTLNPRN